MVLGDTDLVIKLAELNLLDAAAGISGGRKEDLYLLPEVGRVLRSPGFLTRLSDKGLSRTGVSRATDFAAKCSRLQGSVDRNDHVILSRASAHFKGRTIRVDQGEAVLFASSGKLPDHRIATGDKRSLRTIAMCPACKSVCNKLRGRVVCLEQIVLGIIDRRGFAFVQKRVASGCRCDECIENAFAGGKADVTEEQCRKWLEGYVTELRADTSGLLTTC